MPALTSLLISVWVPLGQKDLRKVWDANWAAGTPCSAQSSFSFTVWCCVRKPYQLQLLIAWLILPPYSADVPSKQKVKCKRLQQLGSTVPACSTSDCCHRYFNELCIHPFHSPATQKKSKSDMAKHFGFVFCTLSCIWVERGGRRREKTVRSWSRNILEVHRRNERKELNAWMLSLASYLKPGRENAFKIFKVNDHAKTEAVNTWGERCLIRIRKVFVLSN